MLKQKLYPRSAVQAAQLAAQGSYGTSGDILDHVWYDQLPFAATTMRPQSTFFAVPIGGAYGSGTKTLAETNMGLQSQLPKSQNFIVEAMGIAGIFMAVGTDVDANTITSALLNIIQASTFSLKLAGREFDLQLPGSIFAPALATTALASAANGIAAFGTWSASGWYKLDIPITIESTAQFSVIQQSQSANGTLVTLLNTASDVLATQNAALQIRLKGILTRGK